MSWPAAVTLSGETVVLELLCARHHDDLVAATRDGDLFNIWYTSVPAPEAMAAEIERRLALFEHGTMLPFAVIERSTGIAVGMTSYMNVDPAALRVEIGSTWYRKRVQGTALNTECKLLLLAHAFEALDCIAVEFRTATHNRQSRRAIERLGAKLDGILRSHQRFANGTLRDSCVYSVVAAEWPAVRAGLIYELTRPRS
ncbi:MAG: GNAT family protein [Candidatus Velthaea sp.]|jgi:RimJ/RimL family protein N-acetyltransferase